MQHCSLAAHNALSAILVPGDAGTKGGYAPAAAFALFNRSSFLAPIRASMRNQFALWANAACYCGGIVAARGASLAQELRDEVVAETLW